MTKIQVFNPETKKLETMEYAEGKIIKSSKEVADIAKYDIDKKRIVEQPPLGSTRSRWFQYLMTCSFAEFDKTEGQAIALQDICKDVYRERQFWRKANRGEKGELFEDEAVLEGAGKDMEI